MKLLCGVERMQTANYVLCIRALCVIFMSSDSGIFDKRKFYVLCCELLALKKYKTSNRLKNPNKNMFVITHEYSK